MVAKNLYHPRFCAARDLLQLPKPNAKLLAYLGARQFMDFPFSFIYNMRIYQYLYNVMPRSNISIRTGKLIMVQHATLVAKRTIVSSSSEIVC